MTRDDEVFSDAVTLPAAGRATFLDRACAGDANLRHRVEDLLRAHEDTNSVLDKPPAGIAAQLPWGGEMPGDQIEHYKLLQKIGEGGCGVVYLAEQEKPVRRQIALKVIKPGLDRRAVVARFEAERQVLALMDHPNIARILDAGATASGRLYFAMELVRGIPITQYCIENNLLPRQRLEIFNQVCVAVEHAHQRGVIYHDLKPSNILVTLDDGVPTAKVIDFGIVKAAYGRPAGRTLFAAFEPVLGSA